MDDRLSRRAALLCVVVAAVSLRAAAAGEPAQPAAADGQKYDLRYKLSTGDVLRYDIDHRAAIRSTIDDTSQEAQTKTESTKAWKVTDVLPNKDIEFMSVVERVHMLNHLPDRAPVEYDSQKDKVPPPGFEDTAKAIGVPLSVVRITPRGKVVSHVVKHKQGAAERDAQIVIRLPDEPVTVGATWDEPFDVTVQLEGNATKSLQTRRHYELKSVENGIATIDVAYQVLSPIDAKIESQIVQRLMKGTVRFDVAKGRIDSQTFEIDKRILGFAGPTSSMHYVMRMEEKLNTTKVAQRPTRKPTQSARRQSTSSNRNAPRSAKGGGSQTTKRR
jgi:hypothetical protein